MAARGGLKALIRAAGQRPTALSPSTTVALRSGSVGVLSHAQTFDCTALPNGDSVRWANLKAIQDRMRSVGSVGKITKAMKMVAASKLRNVQKLQENSRPFAVGLQEFFKTLDSLEEEAVAATETEKADGQKSRLIVAVTSDRGLCGGVNSSIVKGVKKMIADEPDVNQSVLLLGDKGRDGLARSHAQSMVVTFKDVFKNNVTFPQVCLIAEDILNRSFDEVTLVYNEFKSVISQNVVMRQIVGLDVLMAQAAAFDEYEFDSDMDSAQVLVDLFEFQLATQLFNACLENATSEQASRMSAMDNASRNASEMLDKLTLSFNRQRQAAITQELSEITSGAAALE